MHNANIRAIKALQAKLDDLRNDESKLHDEIVRSLSGMSRFSADTLSQVLESTRQKILETEEKLAQTQEACEREENRIRDYVEQYDNIQNWAAEFKRAETERKKMILSRMIERITVDREYRIAIYFFIIPEDFQQEMNGFSDKIYVCGCSN